MDWNHDEQGLDRDKEEDENDKSQSPEKDEDFNWLKKGIAQVQVPKPYPHVVIPEAI